MKNSSILAFIEGFVFPIKNNNNKDLDEMEILVLGLLQTRTGVASSSESEGGLECGSFVFNVTSRLEKRLLFQITVFAPPDSDMDLRRGRAGGRARG